MYFYVALPLTPKRVTIKLETKRETLQKSKSPTPACTAMYFSLQSHNSIATRKDHTTDSLFNKGSNFLTFEPYKTMHAESNKAKPCDVCLAPYVGAYRFLWKNDNKIISTVFSATPNHF